jgi:hypothetical protein
MYSFFLCKGIARHNYIIYIWSGFVTCLALAGLLFFLLSMLIIKLLSGVWLLYITPAFITLFLEGIFLISASLFFALVCQQTLAWLATISLFIMCYTSHEWIAILQQQESKVLYFFATITYYLLPDLAMLDIKSSVIYQLPINLSSFLLSSLYIILFSFIFLIGTAWVFEKKLVS